VDNIKMNLRELGWGDMDLSHLAQYRDRWRALVVWVPSDVGKFLSGCTVVGFSRRA
jgi:hypothetical protein